LQGKVTVLTAVETICVWQNNNCDQCALEKKAELSVVSYYSYIIQNSCDYYCYYFSYYWNLIITTSVL